MEEFHCSSCNKLLGKIEGNAEIKCPRCKTINTYKQEMYDEEDKCTKCGKQVELINQVAHAINCRSYGGIKRLNE